MKGIFCLQIRKEGKSGRRTNVLNKKTSVSLHIATRVKTYFEFGKE